LDAFLKKRKPKKWWDQKIEIEYTTKVKLMILIFIGKVVIQTTLVAFFKKINWKLLIQKYIYSVILLSIYDLRSVCDDLRSVC
jgi:hypothetical protein